MRIVIAIAMVIELTISQIDRAQQTARSRDSERAQFHSKYFFKPANDTVIQIEVVTEFRRLVLITEQHLLAGDQMFSRGEREAREALAPTRGLVTLKAQLRFHPQNAYVTVPDFKIAIGQPPVGDLSNQLETKITSDMAAPAKNPRERTAILGAALEASLASTQIGQATVPVGVVLDGKELARTVVDFGRLD
jgi:hypothetical protein